MPVYCGCYIDALWADDEEANVWVWLRSRGWRKLDDRHDDACTHLLLVAAMAKQRSLPVWAHAGPSR